MIPCDQRTMNRSLCREKHRELCFLAILIIGYLTRLVYIISYPVPSRDSYNYRNIIEIWNATNELSTDLNVPPLGLFILKIPNALFGYELIKGGILVNTIIGLLIIALLMKLSLLLTNSTLIMIVTGVLASTYPTLVKYSCQMLRDNAFLLFYLMSLYFILSYVLKKKTAYVFVAGASGISACLCRHEGIEILVLSFMLIFLKKTKRIKAVCIYLISAMASLLVLSLIMNVKISYYTIYLDKFLDRIVIK